MFENRVLALLMRLVIGVAGAAVGMAFVLVLQGTAHSSAQRMAKARVEPNEQRTRQLVEGAGQDGLASRIGCPGPDDRAAQ